MLYSKLITVSCLLFMLSVNLNIYGQSSFVIDGHLKDPRLEGKEIYIVNGKQKIKDVVRNGRFSLRGETSTPIYTILALNQDSLINLAMKSGDTSQLILQSTTKLFLEAGKIKISGSTLGNSIIKGSKHNDEYLKFNKEVENLAKKKNISSEIGINNLRDSLSLVFIDKNPNTYTTIPLLFNINSSYFLSQNSLKVEESINKLMPTIKKRFGTRIINEIEKIRNFGIGSIAPDFTVKSNTGNTISLSDYKGHYVLIEFWAHYCKPCIKEVPFMQEAYNLYNDKGFKILHISLDKPSHKNQWLKAVEKHTSAWDNAINNEGNDNVAKKYGVIGIPDNFLVDPEGKIVAVDLKGDNLKNTLKNLFN